MSACTPVSGKKTLVFSSSPILAECSLCLKIIRANLTIFKCSNKSCSSYKYHADCLKLWQKTQGDTCPHCSADKIVTLQPALIPAESNSEECCDALAVLKSLSGIIII